MTELELLIDLNLCSERQGPGSDAVTRQAIDLARLDPDESLAIADIGCGTGASTFCLVDALSAHVTAVDFADPFIERMRDRIAERGLEHRITPMVGDMTALPFRSEHFDVIWSEGAIYNMGFAEGLRAWRPFLRPDGVIAVSELTWMTAKRPERIDAYWKSEYPGIATLSKNLAVLEQTGYQPLGAFFLPEDCWEDHYYRPLESRFDAFLEQHYGSEAASSVIDANRQEIAMYRAYKASYSYAFYVARRLDRAASK